MNNLYLVGGIRFGEPVTLYIAATTKKSARAAARNLRDGIIIQTIEKLGEVYITEMVN